MTRTAELKAINCTSCGAGLNVLGGGRVIAHVCPYCGAELDAQKDYAVLQKFAKRKRPKSPFPLGLTGRLKGVDWVLIGSIGQREDDYEWVEHQLYSPTHGYAWLTYENGHATFSRRIRRPATPMWISSAEVERAEQPPKALLDGERYVYYETSTPRIAYLEGEFTWTPSLDERSVTVSLLSDTHMLDFGQSSATGERETYRSEYLSRQTIKTAFDIDLPKPEERHPLQPFGGGEHDGFVSRTAAIFAALTLVLAAVVGLSSGGPKVLEDTSLRLSDLPQTLEFEVSQTDRLVRIDFESRPSNAWLFVEIEVLDPEGETLFESGRSMEYYFGRDSDGSWTEGNRFADIQFRPPVAGTYALVAAESEYETWNGGATPTAVTLSVTEGVRAPGWLVLLAIVFGLLALYPRLKGWAQNKVRFLNSDWHDDD